LTILNIEKENIRRKRVNNCHVLDLKNPSDDYCKYIVAKQLSKDICG
jgi:hypothetical protein